MNIMGLVPLLNVEDVGRAAYFYKDALGFRLEESYERDGMLVWASLCFGPVRLMLHQPPWAESETRREAQLLVSDDPGLKHADHTRLRQQVMTRYGQALELGDVG